MRSVMAISMVALAVGGVGPAVAARVGAPLVPAADQIASFAKRPTPATAVSASARARFVADFSFPAAYLPQGVLVISTIDLARLRRFTFAPGGYSVLAAPARSGVVYWLDTRGGANVANFIKGSGMSEGPRMIHGIRHTVIRGITPDGIASIRFDTQAGAHYRTPVRNNVFQFIEPATLNGGVSGYAYVTTSGRVDPEQPRG